MLSRQAFTQMMLYRNNTYSNHHIAIPNEAQFPPFPKLQQLHPTHLLSSYAIRPALHLPPCSLIHQIPRRANISNMKQAHNLANHRVSPPVASEKSEICSSFSDTQMEFIDLASNEPVIPFPEDSRDMFSELTSDVCFEDHHKNIETHLTEDTIVDDDMVAKWEKTGAHNVAKIALGSANSSYLVDGAVIPIKHCISLSKQELSDSKPVNRFIEGKKILKGAMHMQFHDPSTISLPYLDTSEDGILHVIPGWSQREIVEDIAYRFKAGRIMEAEIPFLGGIKCKKRSDVCQGVLVCSKSTESFRFSDHSTVEDDNPDVLRTVELFCDSEIMKRNALHIFREISAKRQFCQVCLWDVKGFPKQCDGRPVVREKRGEVLYGNRFFLGCSGYSKAPTLRHGFRKLDSLDDEGVDFLKGMLSGSIQPPCFDQDKECTYVHAKRRRSSARCEVHNEPLINIPCRGHKMNVFEPIPQPGVDVPQMVYVSCFGKHSHRPPPPPECTMRKMNLLEEEVEADPKASPAVLRKRVEEKIQRQLNDGAGGRKVHGIPHIPVGCGGRKVRKLRQAKRKVVKEAEGIMSLAIDKDYQYCRDIKIVGQDIIVTCAHDAMLMHAASCTRFAADATYKTVTERNRKRASGRWYLYNIIAPARPDGGNTIGVIVFRALVTGLSADVYRVVWRCFLRELISYSDLIRGENVIGSGVLRVPYQHLPPPLVRRSFYITSITTDLETAEVQGCAQAVADLCGGSIDTHIAGLLIGCGVHLNRDLRRRLCSQKIALSTSMSEWERREKYTRFMCAESIEESTKALQEVETFDSNWVKWVRHSGLIPLVCKAHSTMTSEHRADGFTDTNVVESHNRRRNDIAGTHMHPYDAVRELGKLDEIEITKLNSGLNRQLRGPRPPRHRSDYTLSSRGSKDDAVKKRRSRKGIGPAQKKVCLSQSRSKSISEQEVVDVDNEVKEVACSKVKSQKEEGSSSVVHLRVQQMLCCLDKKIAAEEEVSDELKDKRFTAITTLLVAIAKLGNDDIDELKSLILEQRLAAIRDGDRTFSYDLFNIYSQGCVTKDLFPSNDSSNDADN